MYYDSCDLIKVMPRFGELCNLMLSSMLTMFDDFGY